jgi:hypothetical protein
MFGRIKYFVKHTQNLFDNLKVERQGKWDSDRLWWNDHINLIRRLYRLRLYYNC